MLVLELVPEEELITESVNVPTIGIGAGRFTDGQVLINDILGTPRQLKYETLPRPHVNFTIHSPI